MAFQSNNINDYTSILLSVDAQINKSIIFQLLDIDIHQPFDCNDKQKFEILLFGKTKDDKSVFARINDFYPYFFIELPNQDWANNNQCIDLLISQIQQKVYPKRYQDGILHYKTIKRKNFYGFTDNEETFYLQLFFKNFDAMRAFERTLSKKIDEQFSQKMFRKDDPKYAKKYKFKLFESNINPLIRFLHLRNINPAGWISIDSKYIIPDNNDNFTDINLQCKWSEVNTINDDVHESLLHPFTILSFDIECTSEDGKFPTNREGDNIIQIGMTYSKLGNSECYRKIILCLHETAPLQDIEVMWFETERELLIKFGEIVKITNPDFIVGYNIFGFDWNYIKKRADRLQCLHNLSKNLGRVSGRVVNFIEKDLQSSALGQNKMTYFDTIGRVNIDVMKVIQRDFKLASYKLDFVSSHFIRDKIIDWNCDSCSTTLTVKSTFGINIGDYISIYYNDGYTDNQIGSKCQILDIELNNKIIINKKIDLSEYIEHKIMWCQAKDDIEPKDIFRSFKENPQARAKIAKYCIQDCALVARLIAKLQIIPNSMGMSNVCCVPISYLFLRGQGVKIFSLVAKYCNDEGYLVPTIKKKTSINNNNNNIPKQKNNDDSDNDDDTTYDGATVFEPVKGFHDSPVIVYDYGSLYPSSMIMKNISHNSIVLDAKFDNLPNHLYHVQSYVNSDQSTTICKFEETPIGSKATIPRILLALLASRNKCKKAMDNEKDPFKRSIYDGLQLAYKITANSLYGQCGAPTSPIFMKALAACTTSIGRDMLNLARTFAEETLPQIIKLIVSNSDDEYYEFMHHFYEHVDDKSVNKKGVYCGKQQYFDYIKHELYDMLHNYNIKPQCIYGDTDSIFFKLNMTDKSTDEPFVNHDALKLCIKFGPISSSIINYTLPYPHVLNYEKVYWPFIIISKKRYVGNLYDYNPNNFYQKSMGLVTKRRDNADIVKIVVGGIIDQILNKRNKLGAIMFVKQTLMKIISNEYPIDKFVITKTLKDYDSYADWHRIVHAVLAQRIKLRDPGNAPLSNDRIPFVYIEIPPTKNKILQGDRVETPKFIQENNLTIDYAFYITNQIMKPAMQFLELIANNPKALFDYYLKILDDRKCKRMPIMSFFDNDTHNTQSNKISFCV